MATVQVKDTDVRSPREIKRKRLTWLLAGCILLVAVIAALFLVRVDHLIEAHGFVTSADHVELRTPDAQAVLTVAARLAEPGQSVRPGDPLLELAHPTLARELAAAEALLARETAALEALLAARALPPDAAPPHPEVPGTGAAATAGPAIFDPERKAAEAAVHYAQARLAELQARQATLTLRAPIAGTILFYGVEPGSDLAAGQLVAEIYNPDSRQLVLRVRERDSAHIAPGQPLSVSLLGATRSAHLGATLARCDRVIRPTDAGGYREAVAEFDAAPSSDARVGGSVTARINVGKVTLFALIFSP